MAEPWNRARYDRVRLINILVIYGYFTTLSLYQAVDRWWDGAERWMVYWKGFRNKGCWPARVSWQLRGRTEDNINLLVASVRAEMRTRLLTSQERDYRGADKSLARQGRKKARKHVSDARDFNNIETRAVIKFFFPPCKARRQRNSRHFDRNISFFPSWSG